MHVKDVEDTKNVHVFKEVDPDTHKSWFKLGVDLGLEIMDDEEVEVTMEKINI